MSLSNKSKKAEAEEATKKVLGVKAVVEKIEVKLCSNCKTSDNEIATEVLNAFKWNWEIPSDKVKVRVDNGLIYLEGNLTWNYQREAAKRVVSKLNGVKGVINKILLESENNDEIEKIDIENALGRNWSMDDSDIQVKVSGHKVTLKGVVDSWYQKDEAGRIAYNAPGVWSVENELLVDYRNQ